MLSIKYSSTPIAMPMMLWYLPNQSKPFRSIMPKRDQPTSIKRRKSKEANQKHWDEFSHRPPCKLPNIYKAAVIRRAR